MEVVKWTRRQIFNAVHDEWHKDHDNLLKIMQLKLLDKEKALFNIDERSRLALKKVICTLKKKMKKRSPDNGSFFGNQQGLAERFDKHYGK